ncbi:divergent PAP2 family protein [Candidatus Woesearchaeota archaeon]|nr:divergent PAP2 family protein [Candidatus Woesearchaeota archaeon]
MEGLPVILSAVLAWLISLLMKAITLFYKDHDLNIRKILGTGNFPSNHASFIAGATASLYFLQGFSYLFAFAVCVLLVILYDTLTMRAATARNSKLLKSSGMIELHEHTWIDVMVGVLIGMISAYIVSGSGEKVWLILLLDCEG